MDTITFLQTVLPPSGLICTATPYNGGKGFEHQVFDNVRDAAVSSQTTDHYKKNAYFALGTLKERRVEKRQNDGSTKFSVRVHENIHQLKTFFLDIDVKADKPDEHYATLDAAWQALWGFVQAAGLPAPLVVSSGGGLHVYFPFTEPLNRHDWTSQANKLKALCKHYKLLCDHQLTANCANVLRVPGTNNWKTGLPRLVHVMHGGAISPLDTLVAVFDAKVAEWGLNVREAQPTGPKSGLLAAMMIQSEPVDPKPIIMGCQQIGKVVALRGDVSEPHWYATLQVVRHFVNGKAIAHSLSQGHPSYDYGQTEMKLDQLEEQGIGPTTCARFDDVNPGGCAGCKFQNIATSPISIGRLAAAPPPKAEVPEELPQPVAPVQAETQIVSTVMTDVAGQFAELPDTPFPYLRNMEGEILVRKYADKDGDGYKKGDELPPMKILYHDLYPFKREMSLAEGGEVVWFRRFLPHDGWRDFGVPTSALYAPDKIYKVLADNGVLPAQSVKTQVVSYMTAYSQSLQKAGKAVEMHSHFGWLDDGRTFVVGDRVYHPDGKVVKSGVAKAVLDEAKNLSMKGDITEWRKAFDIYNRKGYEQWALMAMLGFGSPLMKFTGYNGLIVDLHGPSGSGKSTATKFAASIFGMPKENILRLDDTGVSKFKVLGTYHNLAVTLDEITNIHPKELSNFAYAITEGREKRRMTSDAVLRSDSESWQTLVLASSNARIMDKLTMAKGNVVAEQSRVFEMYAPVQTGITKQEMDAAKAVLEANHGVAGHIYAHFLVTNNDAVKNRITQVKAYIESKTGSQNNERFWDAVLTVAVVGAGIAKELRLHSYDVAALLEWGIDHIRKLRGQVKESTAGACEVLGRFAQQYAGNMLVTGKVILGDAALVKEPHGELVIRVDVESGMTYIDKRTFRAWCIEQQFSPDEVCDDLVKNSLLVDGHASQRTFSLGSKTHYAGAQVKVLVFDLRQQAAGNGRPAVVEQGERHDLSVLQARHEPSGTFSAQGT